MTYGDVVLHATLNGWLDVVEIAIITIGAVSIAHIVSEFFKK